MPAAFRDVYFPIGIAYGSSLGHMFRTYISANSNGQETRLSEWGPNALAVYDCSKGIHSEDDLAILRAFHRNVQGRLYGFRFIDPSDHILNNEPIDVSAGGMSYQIRKAYSYTDPFTGQTWTDYRRITKPIPGGLTVTQWGLTYTVPSLTVTLDGTPLTIIDASGGGGTPGSLYGEALYGDTISGTTVSIDYLSGLITFVSGLLPKSDSVLTVSGWFSVPVRFDADQFTARAVDFSVWDASVVLREIRD